MPGPTRRDVTPAAALAALVDSVVTAVMEREAIPGAVVAVVRDGRTAVLKGYGVADVATHTPVDPVRTVFGVASVSKTFTALAAVRLAERGTLDLTGDVGAALARPVRTRDVVPPRAASSGSSHLWVPERRYAGAVTVMGLLTHTAGFDDEELGDAARHAAEVEPLGVYLARRMPPQAAPPGILVKYSNHGSTLAGLLIERAAGRPFDAAVAREVFAPLGMASTSFAQPLPPALEARRATGYVRRWGRLRPLARYYARAVPAWGLSTTGADMAHFLERALASDAGASADLPFTPATRGRWLTTAYRPHPLLPGVTPGLFEGQVNGRRALYHEGGMEGFTSYLLLVPEARFGLFVAQNRRTGDLRRALQRAVGDRLFPSAPDTTVPVAVAHVPATGAARASRAAGASDAAPARWAGRYRFNRDDYSHNLMKVLPLLGVSDEVVVTAAPAAGGLVVDGDAAVPVGPGLFRWRDRPGVFAFTAPRPPDVPTTLSLGAVPLATYTRLAWYEAVRAHRVVLGTASVIFLLSLVADGRQRRRSRFQVADRVPTGLTPAHPAHAPEARRDWAGQIAWAISAAHLAFLVGIGGAFALQAGELQFGVPWAVRLLLTLPVAATALTAALAFLQARGTGRSTATAPRAAARHAAVTVASTATLLSLHYWHLLGWRF